MKHLYTVICLLVFLGIGSIGWGQSYNAGYPRVESIGVTSAVAVTNITNIGYITNFIVLEATDAKPTIQNVIDWSSDGNGGVIPSGRYGQIRVTNRGTNNKDQTADITGLNTDVSYICYFVTTRSSDPTFYFEVSTPTEVPFSTLPPPPADYNGGYPKVDNITDNGVEVISNLNTSGYFTSFIILESSAPIPTIQNVLDWSFDGNGGLLPAGTYGDIDISVPGDENSEKFLSATGLDALTDYVVYLVSSTDWTESTAIETIQPSQVSFQTSGPLLVTNYLPLQNEQEVSISQLLELTFNQTITNSSNISGTQYIQIVNNATGLPEQSFFFNSTTYEEAYIQIVDNTLTINLRKDLLVETEYYVMIPSGIIETLNGNSFGGISNAPDNNWRFTTEGAPVWTSGYPLTRGLNDQQVEIAGQSNKAGTYYFVVSNNATVPTAEQVKAGQDASGVPTVYASGSAAMGANLEFSQIIDISDHTLYTPETTLYVYVVATDGVSLLDSEVGATSFTTVGGPVWASGYPLTANLSRDNVDIVGQTDQSGEFVYVVTASATVPTLNQIKNGLNHNGEEALRTNFETPGVMTSNEEFSTSVNITEIDVAPTTYYVYLVATYSGDLDSEIGITSFTTVERVAPTATFEPANDAADVSVSASIVVTYNEAIRNLDGSAITDPKSLVTIPTFTDFSVTLDATMHILTITPNSPFEGGTRYTVVVDPVEDWFGNEQTAALSSRFTTSTYIIWQGGYDDGVDFAASRVNWDIPQNWSATPFGGMNALIPANATYMPTISTNTSNWVSDMVIEPGAELDIAEPVGNLLVTGAFIMESSNSGKGNASFINNGVLNMVDDNKVQIQQNITSSPVKWYYVSAPVSGATPNNINCTGNMEYYDSPVATFTAVGGNNAMEVGRGYRGWSNTNMVFSGPINNDLSYVRDVSQTSINIYGWELLGNPYPCSIDWSQISTNGIINAFWIWINDQAIYGTYNGNALLGANLTEISPSIIPSNHSFWVRAEDDPGSGSITIPSTARTHNQTTYLKGGRAMEQSVVRLVAVNGLKRDETLVAFNALAEDVVDKYDSEKKFAPSYADYFEIYSLVDEEQLTINSYSALVDAKAIPIGVKVPADGDYTIEMDMLKGFPNDAEVRLEDTDAEQVYDLRNGDVKFSSLSGRFDDRFVLHITPGLTTGTESVKDKPVKIYANGNTIYMQVNEDASSYQLHSVTGQLLGQGQLMSNTINSVVTNHKGIIIVTVVGRKKVESQKVFLE